MKKRNTQVTLDKVAYTCELADQKVRIRIHALPQEEKRVHVGKPRFWFEVFGPRYLVRGIDLRYLVQGIGPKWFWSMVLRKA